MTLRASDARVRAIEIEASQVVIEVGQVERVEARLIVAIVAALTEALVVRVFVAARAAPIRAEIRRDAAFVALIVALGALSLLVCVAQRPTGLAVVEAIWIEARPANERVIAAEMLDVTALAFVRAECFAVQAFVAFALHTDVLVTIDAT